MLMEGIHLNLLAHSGRNFTVPLNLMSSYAHGRNLLILIPVLTPVGVVTFTQIIFLYDVNKLLGIGRG